MESVPNNHAPLFFIVSLSSKYTLGNAAAAAALVIHTHSLLVRGRVMTDWERRAEWRIFD